MSTLIIGLGNPGKKYEKTRHNAGFLAVDFLAARLRSETANLRSGGQAPDFKTNKKLKSLMTKIAFDGQDIILAKPTTFMNNSGEAVQALVDYYKIGKKKNRNLSAGALKGGLGAKADKLIIIYDELDLPFETLRVRENGSSAGHNGIKSIIQHLGIDEFWRIRIGTKNELSSKVPAEKFVLNNFSSAEMKKLKEKILPEVMKKLEEIIK
jgi:PTH1 family peptidyl-tRNA hydrolase